MYYLWQFEGVVLPKYNASDDISSPTPRTSFSDLPSGGRIDHYSTARLPLGGMSLTTDFWVYADTPTGLATAMRDLRRLTGVKGNLIRRRDYDGSMQFVEARCMGPRISRSHPRNQCFIECSLTFETTEPVFRDIEGLIWSLDESPPRVLDSGLTLDAGVDVYTISSLPSNVTVNVVDSDMEVRNGEITIKTSGSLVWNTPKITNLRNNISIQYNGTVSVGQELKINFYNKSATLNGVPVYRSMAYGPEQIDWMILEVGSNTLQMSGVFSGSGDATVLHRWEDVYL